MLYYVCTNSGCKGTKKFEYIQILFIFLPKILHICKICSTFEGTDTAQPSHLEGTFALSCKRQSFWKKLRLCKHRQYFFFKNLAYLQNL